MWERRKKAYLRVRGLSLSLNDRIDLQSNPFGLPHVMRTNDNHQLGVVNRLRHALNIVVVPNFHALVEEAWNKKIVQRSCYVLAKRFLAVTSIVKQKHVFGVCRAGVGSWRVNQWRCRPDANTLHVLHLEVLEGLSTGVSRRCRTLLLGLSHAGGVLVSVVCDVARKLVCGCAFVRFQPSEDGAGFEQLDSQ